VDSWSSHIPMDLQSTTNGNCSSSRNDPNLRWQCKCHMIWVNPKHSIQAFQWLWSATIPRSQSPRRYLAIHIVDRRFHQEVVYNLPMNRIQCIEVSIHPLGSVTNANNSIHSLSLPEWLKSRNPLDHQFQPSGNSIEHHIVPFHQFVRIAPRF